MSKPVASYQEDPHIREIDDVMQNVLLTLKILSRAAAKDRPGYRQKVRQGLQDIVDKSMKFADTLDH